MAFWKGGAGQDTNSFDPDRFAKIPESSPTFDTLWPNFFDAGSFNPNEGYIRERYTTGPEYLQCLALCNVVVQSVFFFSLSLLLFGFLGQDPIYSLADPNFLALGINEWDSHGKAFRLPSSGWERFFFSKRRICSSFR